MTTTTLYNISQEGYTKSMTKEQIIERLAYLHDKKIEIETELVSIETGKTELAKLKAKEVKTSEDNLAITRLYIKQSKKAVIEKQKPFIEKEIGILSQVLSSIE